MTDEDRVSFLKECVAQVNTVNARLKRISKGFDLLVAERDFYRERCHSLEAQITQLSELAADAQRVK